MEFQEIIATCKNCEAKVPLSRTKPSKEGPHVICLNCYKQIYGLNDEKIMQSVDPNRTKYSCSYCNYKFSRNKDLCVDSCPYCGKPALNQDQPSVCPTPNKKGMLDY